MVNGIQVLGPHHYLVPSKSRPGEYHEVLLYPVVLCTCEAFYWRGRCRHIEEAKAYEASHPQPTPEEVDIETIISDLYGD